MVEKKKKGRRAGEVQEAPHATKRRKGHKPSGKKRLENAGERTGEGRLEQATLTSLGKGKGPIEKENRHLCNGSGRQDEEELRRTCCLKEIQEKRNI